tara:strand:+ start:1484 stop:2662 length:1179 start_codon:yes stop_codon:yes gene_type:complete
MKQSSLPIPDPTSQSHSRMLSAYIKDMIEKSGGSIGFDQYMNSVLYQPDLGYYSSNIQKFGFTGDFITAPIVSPLFSKCLAYQCSQVLNEIKDSAILEIGAGNGVMAKDLLLELQERDSLPNKYYIFEVSLSLEKAQKKLLKKFLPEYIDNIIWLNTLSKKKFNGLVLANEVLDSLPVKRFKKELNIFKEMKVTFSENRFHWINEIADSNLAEDLKKLESNLPSPFPNDYYSEINIQLKEWINKIQLTIEQGVILFIDYGYSTLDYYHPSRSDGNLLCHYQHHVHNNPFFYPGLQDITTSVNFTAVAQHAEEIGLDVKGYTNQAYFLLGCGIDDLVADDNFSDIQSQIKISQQLKKLIMPEEMGERFKVIALTKKYDKELLCFSKMNQIDRL